jgi:hypothetical protein
MKGFPTIPRAMVFFGSSPVTKHTNYLLLVWIAASFTPYKYVGVQFES